MVADECKDTVAGSLEDIPIAQESKWLDYEGELCAIIGKDCKDIGADENPLDYILGYTVGNDVSSRYWQTPERSTFQAGYAKSFDKFAPCGPYLCSSQLIPDPSKLSLTTKVNGQLRQESNTNDLLFDVPTIVRFLSQGRTLRRGTMIMTGTPSGVALGMADKPWLTDGDVVEVEIEKIGTIRNKFVVQK
jgi:2-keto-4-pentenoate hydratase/2-oxohepta-3-ene-1,7-dioic acid hydratase in catechol pathway